MSGRIRVLFVGGSGVISAACADAVAAAGHELHVVVRGRTSARPFPLGTVVHRADVGNRRDLADAVGDEWFDVVVDFIAFTPSDVARDLEVFHGRMGHYVFISTTAAYRKPAAALPLRESSPLGNRWFPYARDKIACEELLASVIREERVPVTVVRPSFTYDRTTLPIENGADVVRRMRAGRPVLIPGDGAAVCSVMHARDFASVFVPLLGEPRAFGETFHVTSDELLTWLQVYQAIARAAGAPEFDAVSVPSEAIAAAHEEWGSHLLGDKTWPQWYDSAKVRSIVGAVPRPTPFWLGARESIEWLDAHPDADRDDPTIVRATNALIARWAPDASREV